MGPTASGKTGLAIALRRHLPVELISVDSAMIYRGMDIGTAKPNAEVLAKNPHRMIDICDPAEAFSVADFLREAKFHMDEITRQGRIPLLVGGTMLYFRSLLDGLAVIPPTAPEVRVAIAARAEAKGWPALHGELEKVDPETAKIIHPNHSRRIQRALEVFESTGKPISYYRNLHKQGGQAVPGVAECYRVVQLALFPEDRRQLHLDIAGRFRAMLEAGFEEEVKRLYERSDLSENSPSVRAVGYQQMWQYLSGSVNYGQMVEQGIVATRQLAKRQFTWLRKWDELYGLSVDKGLGNTKIMEQLVDNALKTLTIEHIY